MSKRRSTETVMYAWAAVAVTALSLLLGGALFAALGYLFEGVGLPLPRRPFVASVTLVLVVASNAAVFACARTRRRAG